MMWWGKLTRRQKARRWAFAFWSTPVITLFPLWLGAFSEPALVVEYADVFGLFFGLPFAAALLLYRHAARLPDEPEAEER